MSGTTPASAPLLTTLRRRHEQVALPLHLTLFAALLAAAVWGSLWLAAILLAVALANDVVLTSNRSEGEELLDRLGAGPWTRAILRSLLATVTLGVAFDGAELPVALYGIIALAAHGCGLLVRSLGSLMLMRAPVLGVRNIGESLRYRDEIDLVTRIRDLGTFVFLALEWLGFTALSISESHSASNAVTLTIGALAIVPTVALTAAVLWRAWRALRHGSVAYASQLFGELHAYAPECIIYMSAGKAQSGYILNQWLPALDAMKRRAVIVVREASNVKPVGRTTLPVVYAPQTRHVEQLVLPSVRVAFYLANAGRNVHLQREPAIKHIFLNHGDSDKSTSANPVSRVYDEVWVAGEAAIDRYHAAGVDIPTERFAIVGRPQVDPLLVGPLPAGPTKFLLYAPTWEGYYQEANYSSLEVMGVELVKAVLAQRPDLGIIFKPHPATGVQRAGMRAARTEIERLLRQTRSPERYVVAADQPAMTLNDWFDRGDVLVSDISSVVTDFLHTERPILISNPTGMDHDAFRVSFPTQAASYVLDLDLRSLPDLLDDALGGDSLAQARREMKRYVLGDLPDGPLHAFSDNVDRVYVEAAEQAERVRNAFTVAHLEPHLVGDADPASRP